MDLDHISYILESVCSIKSNLPILVGVSGGPDSLALFHILKRLSYQVIPAHFDHLLRPGSTKDAETLAGLLLKTGESLVQGSGDVGEYADRHGLSTEEAARVLRYRFLFDQAQLHKAQAVMTAHTADDQAETILMHILRGSGLSGLTGMIYRQIPNAWSDTIPLVRPLLDVRREEILEYIRINELHPLIDETNTDTRYLRNRIRNVLIPDLEMHYNPQVKNALLRLSKSVQDEISIINSAVENACQLCILESGKDHFQFHLERLKAQSAGIQRQLIRRALIQLAMNQEEIGYEAIQRVIDFLPNISEGKEIQIIEDIYASSMGGNLFVSHAESEGWLNTYPRIDRPMVMECGNCLILGEEWFIQLSQVVMCASEPINIDRQDPYQAVIDADRLHGLLELRTAHAGERFQPYGMNGQMIKISDYFINEKLPRRARSAYPIVVNGEEVVWIPGYRLAHPFRVTRETKNYLVIRLVRRQAEL